MNWWCCSNPWAMGLWDSITPFADEKRWQLHMLTIWLLQTEFFYRIGVELAPYIVGPTTRWHPKHYPWSNCSLLVNMGLEQYKNNVFDICTPGEWGRPTCMYTWNVPLSVEGCWQTESLAHKCMHSNLHHNPGTINAAKQRQQISCNYYPVQK